MSPKPTRILVCGITQVDVSIHFTSCLLKMQTELVRTPGISVEFEFFTSINEALTYFYEQGRFDVCVVLDGHMAVDSNFILQHDLQKPLVIASYPLKTIDWKRVKSKLTIPAQSEESSHEVPSHVGIVYNYDPSEAAPEVGGVYAKVEPSSNVQFKIFKITKAAIDTMIETHGQKVHGNDGSILLYCDGIEDGSVMSADQRFAYLWGRPLYADIVSKTKNMGPYDFTGAVGNRKQLR